MLRQRDLFDAEPESRMIRDYLGIPGLVYFRDLLTAENQRQILAEVDSRPWQDDLKRRVQHYGYKYDYKARTVNFSMYVGPLPEFALEVSQLLLDRGLIDEPPDQLIVNEYRPGQGITAHIDCEPCFKNTIATISLESVYEMDFISLATKAVRSTLLERGSALVLRDEARYGWAHRIQARRTDHGVPRGRRVSLTFRNVILTE